MWAEFPNLGSDGSGPEDDRHQPGATYITQWLEVLERDYSHPRTVGWCPLNLTRLRRIQHRQTAIERDSSLPLQV